MRYHLNEEEERVQLLAGSIGPRAAYKQLIAENDALIRLPDLDSGWEINRKRCAIYTGLVALWFEGEVRKFGYTQPIALIALGGTGRGEMCPCSDRDFGFLFDDQLEGNAFLMHLRRQCVESQEFEEAHGFRIEIDSIDHSSLPGLDSTQLNAFQDARPLVDPTDLLVRMIDRIRALHSPFQRFLHVRGFWQQKCTGNGKLAEHMKDFDIKNDALRLFQAGVWALGVPGFKHSDEVCLRLADEADLRAYEFLLRIRAWIHLRREPGGKPNAFGKHKEDVMQFDDFTSFGDMLPASASEMERSEFANGVRARLLSARRRVGAFARGVIEGEIHRGIAATPDGQILLRAGGLYHLPLPGNSSSERRSKAALALLKTAQHYRLPIDPAELQGTFRKAGQWLMRVQELGELFKDQQGSLAETFEFLSQVDGAVDRLFPGYARFEVSLEDSVISTGDLMRGALERLKMQALEGYVVAGAARVPPTDQTKLVAGDHEDAQVSLVSSALDQDHLVGVKLALKTKRLPLTEEDFAARSNESLPWERRYSSGFSCIPLSDYFTGWEEQAGFTIGALDVTRFLITHRRAFKEFAATGRNDDQQVNRFARLVQTPMRLRALYVFTYADRCHWESERKESHRWWLSQELYTKTLGILDPSVPKIDQGKVMRAAGFQAEDQAVFDGFGKVFFGGMYWSQALRFGSALLRLAAEGDKAPPKAYTYPDGPSYVLGVAAKDRPGLAACICGALHFAGVDVRQAHFFSAVKQGLALDFFHLAENEARQSRSLVPAVEAAIVEQKHLGPEDEESLPKLSGRCSVVQMDTGECSLRYESAVDTRGVIYTLCYKIHCHLGGNIHGLTAFSHPTDAYVIIYFRLPEDISLAQAQRIISNW